MNHHAGQPRAEAVEALRAALPAIVNQVNAKFEVDERYECGSFPCELLEMVTNLQYRFGRTMLGIYEFGLMSRLAPEFAGLVRPVTARGAGPAFPAVVLDSWLMALRTALPAGVRDELAQPLVGLAEQLPRVRLEEEAPPLAGDAGRFFELARDRRRREAAELLVERCAGSDPAGPFDELVVPALARVGELWARNRLSAAEEHGATEVCRYAVLRALDSVEPAAANGLRALVACAPGEEHELGAEMVAGLLELVGWETFLVGRSAPEGEIVAAAERFRPGVALLSATAVATLPGLRGLARALRRALPGTGLVAGGQAAVLARDALRADFDRVASSAAEGRAAAAELAG